MAGVSEGSKDAGQGARGGLHGWAEDGPAKIGAGADAGTRAALVNEVQASLRAVNPVPVEYASPVCHANSRLQPGAPGSQEVVSSFKPRPSSAAIASTALSRREPVDHRHIHTPRPGSAMPVTGMSSPPRQKNSKGMAAALQDDLFIAEAFEERRQSPFEHLGEVGRVLRRYQQQPDLQTMQLSHCLRSIDHVGALADVIVQLPELETLLLAGNDLDDQAFELLGSQLDSPGAASITHLDLADNHLGVASLKQLLPLLRHEELVEMVHVLSRQSTQVASSSRRVRHSDDSGVKGVESGEMRVKEAIAPASPPSPKPGSPRDTGPAAKEAPDQTLDRDPGEFTSWKFLKESSPIAWDEPQPPKNASPAEVARWWRQRTLKKLSRSGKRRTTMLNPGTEPFRGARLCILDLSGNTGIKDVGIELLASAIRKPSTPGLQTLRVARCGLSKLSAVALGKALESGSSLEELDMSWNELGLGGSRALADGIRASKNLATLKLSNSGLSDQGASHIAKALQVNTSIKCLDISGNGVGADTGMVFSATLKINRTLEQLILCNNGLGYTAARRLLQVVHGSPLRQLDLRGCSFFQPGIGAPVTQSLSDSHSKSPDAAIKSSSVSTVFNRKEPEGLYTLDLSNPAHHQVAVELLNLALQEGLLALRGLTVDQKAKKITSPDQVPTRGTLAVRAVALKPSFYSDAPLSEAEFKSRWLDTAGASNVQHRDPYTTAFASRAVRSPPCTSPSPSDRSRAPSTRPSRPSTAPTLRPSSPPHSSAHTLAHTTALNNHNNHTTTTSYNNSNTNNTTNNNSKSDNNNNNSKVLLSQRPHTVHATSGAMLGSGSWGQLWSGVPVQPEQGEQGPPTRDGAGTRRYVAGNGPGAVQSNVSFSEQGEREGLGSWSPGQDKLESVAEVNEECMDGAEGVMQEQQEEDNAEGQLEQQEQGVKHDCHQPRPTQMTRFSSAIQHHHHHHRSDTRPGKARPSSASSVASSEPPSAAEEARRTDITHPNSLSVSLFSLTHVRAASDNWRMSLLEVMIADAFLTCQQLCQVIECMHEPEARLQAALMGFGVLSDPHSLRLVLDVLEPQQVKVFRETLGDLIMYHPANPTGAWTMRLSSPQDAIVARHLLVGFLQQHYMQLTRHPHNVCFTLLMIDGKHHDLPPDPHKIKLPTSGTLNLNFVDLRDVQAPPQPVRLSSPRPPTQPEPVHGEPVHEGSQSPGSAKPLPLSPTSLRPTSPSLPSSTSHKAYPLPPAASPLAAHPKKSAVEATAAADTSADDATKAVAEHEMPKQPVIFSKPVLLDDGQMEALLAALQHWPTLDPIRLVQLVDTSGCMQAQQAMLALGYPQKPTWAEAFQEQELHEVDYTHEEGGAVHGAAKLLASGGDTQHWKRQLSVPRQPASGLLRTPSSARPLSGQQSSASSSSRRPSSAVRPQSAELRPSSAAKRTVPASTSQAAEPAHSGSQAVMAPAFQVAEQAHIGSQMQHAHTGSQTQQALEAPGLAAGPSAAPSTVGQSVRSRASDGWGPAVKGDHLMGLRDHAGFVEAMRMLAVSHYVTCEQLVTLLALLPVVNKRGAASLGVELCTTFWARIVDRNPPDPLMGGFTSVIRRLAPQQQVCLAQRLGYMNIFNRKRPAMHYCLRMYRADEHEIAWQLFNMAINASHTCFLDFCVDGVPKKVNQGPNMWPVMNGNAATGTVPQTTCEFDFAWDPKVVAEAAKAKKKKR